MRNLFFIAVIGIIFASCSSSSENKTPTTSILTILDKTEGQKYQNAITVDWYLAQIGVDPSGLAIKSNGQGSLLFSEFSAFALNRMQKFELSFAGVADNPLMKQSQITKFTNQLRPGIQSILDSSAEAENSQIFGPLVQSLSQMNSSADRKIVLLFSDMIENGGQVSFYKSPPTEADKVKLETQYGQKMPNLSGIEISIVYNPASNPKTAELARQSAKFFAEWMKSKGANVEVVANIL